MRGTLLSLFCCAVMIDGILTLLIGRLATAGMSPGYAPR